MLPDPTTTRRPPRPTPPLDGVPVLRLDLGPKRQLRVLAEASTAWGALVRMQYYRPAAAGGPYAGEWIPEANSAAVPLERAEELIAALARVAEVARDRTAWSPARGKSAA